MMHNASRRQSYGLCVITVTIQTLSGAQITLNHVKWPSMSVEDSTVVTAPLSTDASWLVLRVPQDRSTVLLWERSPGLGQLETLRLWAEVTAAADVVGWQRMAVEQQPWQSHGAGKQRGCFRHDTTGDPRSCAGPKQCPEAPRGPADRARPPRLPSGSFTGTKRKVFVSHVPSKLSDSLCNYH